MTARRAIATAAKPAAPSEPAAADEFEQLARQVGALRLSWSDPWRFYEQRSDLAARLRRLARWAREAEARAEGRSV
jgi:hypothetical protein